MPSYSFVTALLVACAFATLAFASPVPEEQTSVAKRGGGGGLAAILTLVTQLQADIVLLHMAVNRLPRWMPEQNTNFSRGYTDFLALMMEHM